MAWHRLQEFGRKNVTRVMSGEELYVKYLA